MENVIFIGLAIIIMLGGLALLYASIHASRRLSLELEWWEMDVTPQSTRFVKIKIWALRSLGIFNVVLSLLIIVGLFAPSVWGPIPVTIIVLPFIVFTLFSLVGWILYLRIKAIHFEKGPFICSL